MDVITAAVEEALRIDDDWREAMRQKRRPKPVRYRCADCRGKGVVFPRRGTFRVSGTGIPCQTCDGKGEL